MSEDKSGPNPIYLDEAFRLALQAESVQEVPIGCVIVYESKIIGGGRNRTNEGKNARFHAELLALDEAHIWTSLNHLDFTKVIAQSDLYVTVEPCLMCASGLEELKIRCIYYGCDNSRFGGCGSVGNAFTSYVPTISKGWRASEAIELLQNFYKSQNPNAPIPHRKNYQ